MPEPAIRVRGLGKRYTIGERVRHDMVRDAVVAAVTSPLRLLKTLLGGSQAAAVGRAPETFWALEDIEFEVPRGSVVGIIGRNGAGKSTLLKILSRITEPTVGEAFITGCVGSLLEVGTGFHQELTGRENVFLSGALLGMRRAQITARFDEIVEFAGIERFIDTPVKRYSSGMRVRLGFAVAAHLDTDVLMIDEVLAVGDAEFRKRCLGRMSSVAESGRTVLFVSHNMAAIANLCQRCLVLQSGRCVYDGDVERAIELYLGDSAGGDAEVDLESAVDRKGSLVARFTSLRMEDASGEASRAVRMGRPFTFVLRFRSERPVSGLNLAIIVRNHLGQLAFRLQANEILDELPSTVDGGVARCRVPEIPLLPGLYRITVALAAESEGQLDHIDQAATFTVVEADVFGTGRYPTSHTGMVFQRSEWTFS